MRIRSAWPCPRRAAFIAFLAIAIAGSRPVPAQCAPAWSTGFGIPGVELVPVGMTTTDIGGRPLLVMSGPLSHAGEKVASNVVTWDGTTFGTLGAMTGMSETMTTFDDGNGPKLYAGGEPIFGMPVIARFDGATWTPIPGTFSPTTSNIVVAGLVVYAENGVPTLFACGTFVSVDGTTVNRIARWNGAGWTSLQGGANDHVVCMWVHDDGTGAQLYAGGSFTAIGGINADGIARWNGMAWSPVGSPAPGAGVTHAQVYAMTTYDDGTGPALFASGRIAAPGADPGGGFARWDGAAWSPLGNGAGSFAMNKLAVFDGGSGPLLYCGSSFNSPYGYLAVWNGSTWAPHPSPTNGSVSAMSVFDDGTGPRLYVAGNFSRAGTFATRFIASWNGQSWAPLFDDEPGGFYDAVALETLFVGDLGQGPTLFATGDFTVAGTTPANLVAAYSGGDWRALGPGPGAGFPRGLAMEVFDGGSGRELWLGGDYFASPSQGHLTRWNGLAWTPPLALDGRIGALKADDDGMGMRLFAGGSFTSIGGVAAPGVASWNGSTWSSESGTALGSIASFIVADTGNGPRLHAAANVGSAPGQVTGSVWRKEGSGWVRLGPAFAGNIASLLVFDAGLGPRLYALGAFNLIGGSAVTAAARWEGSAWVSTGSTSPKLAACVADAGSGPRIFAGGYSGLLTRFDGATWSNVGNGSEPAAGGIPAARINAMAGFDDGRGSALFIGGLFTVVGNRTCAKIARLGLQRPRLEVVQGAGPGSPSDVVLDYLIPDRETWCVFSPTVCAGPPGSGPYLGLCASDPGLLYAQIMAPLGALPFHFVPPHSRLRLGPYPLPPGITLDGVCFSALNGVLDCPSYVHRRHFH